jgi:hypothetical protein
MFKRSRKKESSGEHKDVAASIKKIQRAASRWWKAGQKLWSIRGAAAITGAAALISIIQILVAVHGKLVILPFEVRSDQNTPSDLGASFSASLSIALNEYRSLFPSSDGRRRTAASKNSFDLVQSFMSDLPFVEIPRSSPLNKGATVLEAIKVGPVQIPVTQVVFESLAFFHEDTLRGTLEVWGDRLVARTSLGDDEAITTVSVSKDQGYGALIERITVELLQKKNWIFPIPMKLPALMLFSKGLQNYLSYDLYAEESFINAAREKYEGAVEADPDADLARLHLAATQYVSNDAEIIAKSINNFSLLLSDQHFNRAARIGYVASSLRYIDRVGGCVGAYRFMAPILQEVQSWERDGKLADGVEEQFLWSATFQLAVDYLLPGRPCAPWVQSILGQASVAELFDKVKQGFEKVRKQIAEPGRYPDDLAKRYQLRVLLNTKYLLDDEVDYSLLSKKTDLKVANAALELGKEIEKQKESLPKEQRRFFAPSISGSVADSYLRMAKINETDVTAVRPLVSAAIDQLRMTLSSTDPITAQWALFRLADLEMARSNAGLSVEWLIRAYGGTPVFSKLFDEDYFPLGILVEKPNSRCDAIKLLRKGNRAGSIASRLLLIDSLRRSGDLSGAEAVADALEASTDLSTKWAGGAIQRRLSLVMAKLRPQDRSHLDSSGLWKQFDSLGPEEEFLKFDIYELAQIAKDDALLTKLKLKIFFKPLDQPNVVQSSCLS